MGPTDVTGAGDVEVQVAIQPILGGFSHCPQIVA